MSDGPTLTKVWEFNESLSKVFKINSVKSEENLGEWSRDNKLAIHREDL